MQMNPSGTERTLSRLPWCACGFPMVSSGVGSAVYCLHRRVIACSVEKREREGDGFITIDDRVTSLRSSTP
eukprot:88162-Lingulodinium_polyedra.AAC.1